MNYLLFSVIGFLMFAITGIGVAEVQALRHNDTNDAVASSIITETNVAAAAQGGSEGSNRGAGDAEATLALSAEPTVGEVLADVATTVTSTLFDTVEDMFFSRSDDEAEDESEDEWEEEHGDDDEDEDEDEDDHRSSKSVASASTKTTAAGSAKVQTGSTNTGTNTNTGTVTATSFTMAQVAQHASAASCYTVVSGSVYDVTAFVTKHPGGQSAIKSMCGVDGTAAFSAQHGGQGSPASTLAKYKIGVLVQ